MTRAVEIVGHRGARGLFPENTIDGFREAFDLGVRTFELDVGMTADGVVVVSHDLALNPAITRDGSGRFLSGTPPLIHALPWSELCRFDVGRIRPGSPYRMAHRAQQPNDGARVPRLADVLREVPGARLVIELKTDPRYPERTVPAEHLADAVLAIVDAAGAAERVIVESFDWRGPLHIRRIRPHMRLAWLTRPETERDAALWWNGLTPEAFGGCVPATVAAQSREMPGDIWAPAYESLTRPRVSKAHDLGLRVVPWTVNRRAAMRRLLGWGVDGLITDRPDTAMVVCAATATPDQSA